MFDVPTKQLLPVHASGDWHHDFQRQRYLEPADRRSVKRTRVQLQSWQLDCRRADAPGARTLTESESSTLSPPYFMTAGTGLDCSLGNFVELAHHLGVEPVVIRTPTPRIRPRPWHALRISLVAAYGKRLCVDLIELGLFSSGVMTLRVYVALWYRASVKPGRWALNRRPF